MNELERARKEIAQIDEEMSKLFCKRMKVAKVIAKYKRLHGLPIFDAVREAAVIEHGSSALVDDELKTYYINFLQNVMDISKRYQENLNANER